MKKLKKKKGRLGGRGRKKGKEWKMTGLFCVGFW